MEAIFNDTLTVLTILFVVSVWGMVGAIIVSLVDANLDNMESLISALLWPVVLVFMAIERVTLWIKQQ